MTSILFACELGEGLGHLNRLIAVARHLTGHDLAFAVGDELQRGALRAAFGPAVRVVAHPSLPHSAVDPDAHRPDLSLADTLRRIGFADRDAVTAAADAWGRIVDEVRPDAVVGDYAPTLRVAVAGRIPQVVIGDGFTVPPRMATLPSYEGATEPVERSRAAEAAVLACFNGVRGARGSAPFACLADALQGDATFVAAYPFLDPYRVLRIAAPLQPFNLPAVPAGPAVAVRAGPHVFAYLDANYPGVNVVLSALNRMGRRAEVFVRNAGHAEVVRNCAPHVRVHAAPADFVRILPQTRLLVHHGGSATSAAGLLAGVPQLTLPRHTEQLLNARGLATLGTSVGLGIGAEADVGGLTRLMLRMLDVPDVADRAVAVALDLQASRVASPESPVVAAIEAMLSGGGIPLPAAVPAPPAAKLPKPAPPEDLRPARTPQSRMAAIMAAANDRPAGRTSRSYIICSSPRVGSNMLCDALTARRGGGRPIEYLNEFATGAYLRRIGAQSLPTEDYLDYLFSRRTDDAGTFGIKVQHHQLLAAFPSAESQHAFLKRFDAVLFLRRRNRLRQAISETRARASFTWYAEDAQHLAEARKAANLYDRAAIAKYLAYIVADDSGWERLLHASRIPHTVEFYEDMVQDFPEALARISAHLGLDLALDGQVAPTTHRFSDALNEDWEGRFRRDVLGDGEGRTAAE